MKILVVFKQHSGDWLSKEIELCAMPVPGSWFQYEDGWSMARVAFPGIGETGMALNFLPGGVEIVGYGEQFTPLEIESLQKLGWELRS